MTPEIKQNEDNWQERISTFHTYLEQSVESLTHKQETTEVDTPSPQNPRIAASRKKTKVLPEVKHSTPVPLIPVDKEQVTKSSTRHYSSPLWVGLGDENPGRSNSKTKHKKKAK